MKYFRYDDLPTIVTIMEEPVDGGIFYYWDVYYKNGDITRGFLNEREYNQKMKFSELVPMTNLEIAVFKGVCTEYKDV